jgi:peptide/nickel transport system permease protein
VKTPAESWRRLSPLARTGLMISAAMVALSIVVPVVSPFSSTALVGPALQPPSTEFWFGTDQLGRDLFTRTFSAGRVTISLALIGVVIPLLVGTILGAVLGTTRSRVVTAIWTTLIDGINAFPLIILIIAIVAAVGPGVTGIVIAVLLTNWARYARVARARAIVVSKTEYVQALSLLGYSRPRIILKHILPNTYSETLAYAFSDFVIIVTTVAGLSFLGLGVRPPEAEWGAMISEGRLFLVQAPWIVLFPGIALSLTATGVALLAGGRKAKATKKEVQDEPAITVTNV